MNLIKLFIILNVVNVIIQTIKSICTVKCGKWIAAIINCVAYGIYTVVLVYMNCDIPLWQKVAAVSGSNLVGVFIVKLIEEKARKERLWKIEFTINTQKYESFRVEKGLAIKKIPYRYEEMGKHTIFTAYCSTKEESKEVFKMVEEFGGKFFVTESKIF